MLSRADVAILASGFRSLFSTLSTWGPDNGILLDISVYSPSDSEHWMQYSPLRPDIPLDECGRSQDMEQALLPNVVDYEDDNIVGNEDCVCRLSSNLSKCFGAIGNEDSLSDGEEQEARWWQGLPLVPAVTGILLRQQTRRRGSPVTLAHIFSRLPRLHEIYYAPRMDADPDAQMLLDEGQHLLCRTTRCCTIHW